MDAHRIGNEVEDLKHSFGPVTCAIAADGGQLVRIPPITLPPGCKPTSTPVLLNVKTGRPQIYVKPGIILANGVSPRSTSVVSVEGEAWLQFSFTFPWEEESNTLLQFVAASLRRFGLTE